MEYRTILVVRKCVSYVALLQVGFVYDCLCHAGILEHMLTNVGVHLEKIAFFRQRFTAIWRSG